MLVEFDLCPGSTFINVLYIIFTNYKSTVILVLVNIYF